MSVKGLSGRYDHHLLRSVFPASAKDYNDVSQDRRSCESLPSGQGLYGMIFPLRTYYLKRVANHIPASQAFRSGILGSRFFHVSAVPPASDRLWDSGHSSRLIRPAIASGGHRSSLALVGLSSSHVSGRGRESTRSRSVEGSVSLVILCAEGPGGLDDAYSCFGSIEGNEWSVQTD
jgi:hypothetical protein